MSASPPASPQRAPDAVRGLVLRRFVVGAAAAWGYYVCADLGYAYTIRPAGIAVVWPPSGFMLAMLVLLGKRDWPFALAGAFLGNLTADLLNGASVAVAVEGSAVNCIEVLLAAWTIVRFAGPVVTLETLRQVSVWIAGAAIGSNALTALLGAGVLVHATGMAFWKAWFVWWVGDGMGMLIVGPAILTWIGAARTRRTRLQWRTIAEAGVLFASVSVAAHVILSQAPDPSRALSPEPYMMFPLLFWAAVRLGPPGAATATLILASITVWHAAQGRGPFAEPGQASTNTLLQMYAFLALASLTGLIAASMLRERAVAEADVRERARHAAFLADVGGALTETGSLHDVLTRCAGAIARFLGAVHTTLWTISGSEAGLELEASAGSAPMPFDVDRRALVGQRELARLAQEQRALVTHDLAGDPQLFNQDWVTRERPVGFAAYPLVVRDQPLGLLAIFTRETLSARTQETLASVARVLALGIERKRLEESRKQLADILEATPDFVTIGRLDGPPTYINRAAREALGIESMERVDSLLAFRADDYRELFWTVVLPTVLRDGSWRGETEYRSRTGQMIPVSQVSVAHRNAAGDLAFLSTISRDISDRRRVEAALRESEARFRLLARALESTNEMVSVTDLDDRFTFVNRAFLDTYGYTADEVIGRTPEILQVPGTPQALFEEIARKTREGSWQGELRNRRRDGTELLISLNTSLIRDPEGDVIGLLGVARDITERRSLEEQLRQSQKMEAIGKLAGGIAHDFNNLLTAILGYSSLLGESLTAEDARRHEVDQIQQAAERAARLTRQLLAFSRKQIMAPRVLRLGDVVSGLIPMLHRLLGETIDLKAILGDHGSIKADIGQLEQVLVNLAVNARDAMPAGGHLTIETSDVELDETYARQHAAVEPGAHVVLVVSDTGHGMDAATQQRLFEPFFTTRPIGQGTGLGLATVHGIVAQSGGHVAVYSEVGFGATFKVYLPRTDAAPETVAASPAGPDAGRGNEIILLVEDEEIVRQFAHKVLVRNGYTVHAMGTPARAIEFAKSHRDRIDVILSDVVLPHMSGRALVNELQQHHPESRVLYMSGYTDSAIVHHGVLEPGMWFLQKPFSGDALLRKLRELLDA
jgi:PAS domain S-box-containing protein